MALRGGGGKFRFPSRDRGTGRVSFVENTVKRSLTSFKLPLSKILERPNDKKKQGSSSARGDSDLLVAVAEFNERKFVVSSFKYIFKNRIIVLLVSFPLNCLAGRVSFSFLNNNFSFKIYVV